LNHGDREAEKFYRGLAAQGVSVRVGMEATGYSRWFERLLAELGLEVWIGDAAEIKTKRVRKQKTDREDARLMLRLMRENNFPRIWVLSPENCDLRQLLWHRHRLVQMRIFQVPPSAGVTGLQSLVSLLHRMMVFMVRSIVE
jgi:transposase